MAHSRYARDSGLTARMTVTMFLLGLVYVVGIAAVVAVVGFESLPIVLIVAGGFFFFQYAASDRIALYAMHARVVSPQEAPQLHAVVDRLCALADMPKPRVAIANSDVPNAFATGRSPSRAVVCATTGLMRRLDPDELEGVLAHELSHVAHRDVAVMTIAGFMGVLAGFITRFALQMSFFGGAGRGRRDDRTLPVIFAIILISALVYALSFVLIRTLSRYRELSADRTGAQLTGRPSALAAALTKVSGAMGQIPTRDLREAEPINAFFFTPALSSGFSLSSLFATHPPLDKRLEQLSRMSGQIGQR
jgi:heat shock protein HtpX